MKKKLRLLLEILIVILGNAMYAFSVVAFVKPIGLITGGTTGIALFINKLFGGNISISVCQKRSRSAAFSDIIGPGDE